MNKLKLGLNKKMKKIILLAFLILICLSGLVLAEEKPAGEMIPKLTATEMIDAPTIVNSEVYPFWGVPCTNYTYFAIYKDGKGRQPEYMRINLNGQWWDMNWLKGEPKSGATYVYNYVPNSGSTNFYYYEASNGVGKVRGSIIDSPDNGPVLFSEKLDNNEIILLDKEGKEVWNYPIGRDWVEGVAISKDGNYIAAVTNFYIYLFSKDSNKPVWSFCKMDCENPSVLSGNSHGIAISADGSYIVGELDGTLYFFSKESNKPLWTKNIESGAIGIDMSDDGKVVAAGTGNADGGRGQKILLFDKEGNKLGEYKPAHPGYDQTGDFYQPDVTPDGKYVAVSTGCPDRRAYLFSGKEDLLFRSEQMTEDSPVHKSAISDDGSLIAYSADHQQGKEILFLFDNKGKKIWSFSSPNDGTARAVSISNDGNYAAIGTSGGHVYLFSKNSNKPLWESPVNTWITKIDFNGEYIVAGTGPREYLFEGESVSPDKIQCKEIIRPEPFENYLKTMGGENGEGASIEKKGSCIGDCIEGDEESGTGQPSELFCGNGLCENPQESYETCPQDCCPPTGCNDDSENELEKGNSGVTEVFKEESININTAEKSFFGKIIGWFKGWFK